MTVTKFTTTILKASEGFVLTQSAEVNPEDRIFASELALGANDKAENYVELSLEQARPLMDAQEETRQQKQ